MPMDPHRNIRSVLPGANPVILGDSALHQILRHPDVERTIPELAFAARMLRGAETMFSTGCRSCVAGRRIRAALESSKLKLAAMPPHRLAELKKLLGIQGRMKIFIRQGARVVPIVV